MVYHSAEQYSTVLFCAESDWDWPGSAVYYNAVREKRRLWQCTLVPGFQLTSGLHCTVLHCTTLYCTALHWTILHFTALHCTALSCTALHCTVFHWNALQWDSVYCSALNWTEMRYTLLKFLHKCSSDLPHPDSRSVHSEIYMKKCYWCHSVWYLV